MITTGNEQVRSIAAHLAGDTAAADQVQLVLPATGVCSTDLPTAGSDSAGTDTAAGGGCCGSSEATAPTAPRGEQPRRGFATGLPGGRTAADAAPAGGAGGPCCG